MYFFLKLFIQQRHHNASQPRFCYLHFNMLQIVVTTDHVGCRTMFYLCLYLAHLSRLKMLENSRFYIGCSAGSSLTYPGRQIFLPSIASVLKRLQWNGNVVSVDTECYCFVGGLSVRATDVIHTRRCRCLPVGVTAC